MELQYIFGGSGTGKTAFCFKEMLEMSKDRDKNIIYLVPEQYSLEAEKSLASKAEGKAIMQIQVLNFNRLAFHMFSQTGVKASKNLDDMSKSMLVRKIISKCKGKFQYFKNTNINPGFVEKVCEIIKEIFQYSLKLEELEACAEKDTPLGLKLRDILLIYKNYISYIQDNYISADETLDLLAQNIDKLHFLKDAHIYMDNFSGFTPQEYKVISGLFKMAAKINICLAVKSNNIYHSELKKRDIFFEVKKSINKITALAKETGAKIPNPIYLRESFRFQSKEELKFIDRNYFSYASLKFNGKNDRIKIYQASNRYSEIEFAAKQITKLTRESNYRYSEIGILCADLKNYEHIAEHIFNEYRIPLFADTRMEILSHPLTEMIRSVVEIVVKNWSYESVFRFLKSGLVPISEEECCDLENYILAYGIKGYRWSQAEWLYGFGKQSLFDHEKIHETKAKASAYINYFAEGLTRTTILTVRTFLEKIFQLLSKLEIKEKLEEMYHEAEAENDTALMRRHFGVWQEIAGVFDRMVDIFGDTLVNTAEFCEILETGILSCDMGTVPPVSDRIILGDVYRSRLPEIKILFVIGAVENEFPKARKDEGLLLDNDKKELADMGLELAPDSTQAMYNDNFLIYSVLTKPSDMLILTYPKGSLEGKTMFPSHVVSRIEMLFENTEIEDDEKYISMPAPMLKDAAEAIGERLRGKDTGEIKESLIKWYESQHEYKDYIAKTKEAVSKKQKEKLDEKTIGSLYENVLSTSVSRLEKYMECPFAFFIQYNLGLKERKIFKVGSLDMGNLFHSILEEFSKILFTEKLEWGNLSDAEIEKYVDKAFEIVVKNFKSDIFLSEAPSRFILERAKRTAKKSIWALSMHVRRGSFKAYGAEVDFGIKSPLTGITIEINNEFSFRLSGKIDRIDIFDKDGKKYVKIIDYKSGNVKLDYTDIYYGMQLQLLLYMDSILKNAKSLINAEGEVSPGGMFYFRINDPLLEYDEKLCGDLDKYILEQFKMSGLVLENDDVIEALDNKIEKSSAVVSVNKNSKGGYGSRTGALVNEEKFNQIMAYSVDKAKEIGRRMIQGEITPMPYKKGTRTGCDYCRYKGICTFDPRENKYNIMSKKNAFEDF